jgi:hypothetical protein
MLPLCPTERWPKSPEVELPWLNCVCAGAEAAQTLIPTSTPAPKSFRNMTSLPLGRVRPTPAAIGRGTLPKRPPSPPLL